MRRRDVRLIGVFPPYSLLGHHTDILVHFSWFFLPYFPRCPSGLTPTPSCPPIVSFHNDRNIQSSHHTAKRALLAFRSQPVRCPDFRGPPPQLWRLFSDPHYSFQERFCVFGNRADSHPGTSFTLNTGSLMRFGPPPLWPQLPRTNRAKLDSEGLFERARRNDNGDHNFDRVRIASFARF